MTPADEARYLRERRREIENLARDICWAEFKPKPKGETKASYWKRVHPDRQVEYIRDAEWLIFIAKELKPLRILALVELPSNRRSRR